MVCPITEGDHKRAQHFKNVKYIKQKTHLQRLSKVNTENKHIKFKAVT